MTNAGVCLACGGFLGNDELCDCGTVVGALMSVGELPGVGPYAVAVEFGDAESVRQLAALLGDDVTVGPAPRATKTKARMAAFSGHEWALLYEKARTELDELIARLPSCFRCHEKATVRLVNRPTVLCDVHAAELAAASDELDTWRTEELPWAPSLRAMWERRQSSRRQSDTARERLGDELLRRLEAGEKVVQFDDIREMLDAAAKESDARRTTASVEHKARYDPQRRRLTRCQSDDDGYCDWDECPQTRDNEPARSGRHCPLDCDEKEEANAQPFYDSVIRTS